MLWYDMLILAPSLKSSSVGLAPTHRTRTCKRPCCCCCCCFCGHTRHGRAPTFPTPLQHFAPLVRSSRHTALCLVFMLILITLPRLKMCNLNPTETSTCRRCQSDSGRAIPSLLGCSISLACDPHTSRGGGDLPTPSISTCPLSSILPSIFSPPSALASGCTARVRGGNSVEPAQIRKKRERKKKGIYTV